MARAKRTQRADARRRYRSLQAETIAEAGAEEGQPSPPAESRRVKQARGGADAPVAVPGQRYGFLQAVRLAYRPVHYRDDFRSLPRLLFRTNAFWPSALLILVAAGAVSIDRDTNSVGFQLGAAVLGLGQGGIGFIPAVLAGFLTPRAAWLVGSIVTLLGILVTFLVGSAYFKYQVTLELIPQVLIGSIVYGAAFGSASAWYKRFLSFLMAPQAGGRGGSRGKPQPKPAARTAKPAVAGRRRP